MRSVEQEARRTLMGLAGILLAGAMAARLWRWHCLNGYYKTIWEAIAGRAHTSLSLRWTCGFWELSPDGPLAAMAMLALTASLIGAALLNWRVFYIVAFGAIIGGYLVNACFMLKLMAAY